MKNKKKIGAYIKINMKNISYDYESKFIKTVI